MDVGFIGLGIMGRPMALNLLKRKHSLTVWSRRSESMQPLLDAGAQGAASPAEVASTVDVLFTVLPDAPDVREVMLGEHGAAKGAREGLIAVDMSTMNPIAARQIAAELQALGIDFLDAPVSGGEVGAIAGTLSIMAGGSPDVFLKVKPLFECMGKSAIHLGESGAGQAAKAANQIITGVNVLTIAEAFSFARKNGVDLVKLKEALMGGSAYSKTLEIHGPRMLERNFKPGFKSWMRQKDMNIVMQTAHALGVYLPVTAATAQLYNAMVANNLGEEDQTAVFKLLEQLSGEEISSSKGSAKSD